MKVTVKKSTVVKPASETPTASLWLANPDLIIKHPYYSRCVSFYRHNGAGDFFEAAALMAALGEALVYFYPYAGRLRKDEDGRLEINCNGEGAVLMEAECDTTLDELGDFTPRPDVILLPEIDTSIPISKLPLSLIQLTRFRCGGVCLGVINEHHVADGMAGLHYFNTWLEIARGLTPTARPFLNRRLLAARHPPRPQFPHVEHHLLPSLTAPLDTSETSFKMFRLSRDQITALQRKCVHSDAQGNKKTYTRYETVAGHVWRSTCIARKLPGGQVSKLRFPVDGRPILRPPLPRHYFGNGIFQTTAFATCGEIERNPLRFAVEKVHEAVLRMDDEYIRSSLDYLEVERPKSESTTGNVRCPNLGITNWIGLPFYEADFGWGKPVFAGPGEAVFEGKSYVCVDPQNERGLLIAITLYKQHMERFEKLLYDDVFLSHRSNL